MKLLAARNCISPSGWLLERLSERYAEAVNAKEAPPLDAILVTQEVATPFRQWPLFRSIVGEWLSLVEHLVRDQGVGGSNPLSPTNNPNLILVG